MRKYNQLARDYLVPRFKIKYVIKPGRDVMFY